MIVTYKNNRLVPAAIVTLCFWASYSLIDTDGKNWGAVLTTRGMKDHVRQHTPQQDTAPLTLQRATDTPGTIPTSTVLPGDDSRSTLQQPPSGNLTAGDVLLILRTGSTSMWKRLLVHLPTTLSPNRIPAENTVIYSDHPETIGSFTLVDALANITKGTKALPEFDVYQQQVEYERHNVYVEAAGVDGDNYGPPGGWVIDKFKFMPIMHHAGANWPEAKWYVYMEDDTYLFLPSVLDYLSGFDWRKPHYLGSYAAKSDVVFAHGGAGFALSRAAWTQSFGRKPGLAEAYEHYTAAHCCGDQVLGHALQSLGVLFGENGGDEKFTWGFNPIVHWRFGFSRWNWCSRLMSWHKVHNRDVARYYEFEKTWDYSKTLLHRDFFLAMIAPNLHRQAEWWDNLSALFSVTSANKASPPTPETAYDKTAWNNAWRSADACETACVSWVDCVQWSFVEDLCRMDDKLIVGQGYAPSMSERKTALKTTSGWLKERLDGWHCD